MMAFLVSEKYRNLGVTYTVLWYGQECSEKNLLPVLTCIMVVRVADTVEAVGYGFCARPISVQTLLFRGATPDPPLTQC